MEVKITFPEEKYIPSFFDALTIVAREQIYLEMTEPPPLEKIVEFQKNLIAHNHPVYYALHENLVVGWCDASPYKNPRLSHRAALGMGLIPEFRGKGLGSKLLSAVLEHAKTIGIEKIELHVYTSNQHAVALYQKFGFEQEGLIQKYRKLDGKYFDCLAMAKFL